MFNQLKQRWAYGKPVVENTQHAENDDEHPIFRTIREKEGISTDHLIRGETIRKHGGDIKQLKKDKHIAEYGEGTDQWFKLHPSYRKNKKSSQHAENDSKHHVKNKYGSQHSELQPIATPAPTPIAHVGNLQFAERNGDESQDEDKNHQHIMNRLGYKHYKGGSYFHGPTSGAKNVMKNAKDGTYQFLNGHNFKQNKWGMSKKELYEHLDQVHGGFESLTRKTPHQASKE